jgi:hypothetical protein
MAGKVGRLLEALARTRCFCGKLASSYYSQREFVGKDGWGSREVLRCSI